MPANTFDFFGEGTADQGTAAPGAAPDIGAKNAWIDANKDAKGKDLLTTNAPASSATSYGGKSMFADGGTWDNFSDTTKDSYNYYRDIRDPSSMSGFVDSLGERVGVRNAGATILGDGLSIQNPLDFNPGKQILDPQNGLGATVDGTGGTPIGAGMDPRLREGLSKGIGDQTGDALTQAMAGIGGGQTFNLDSSGADRGGMGLGGAYSQQLGDATQQGVNARALGSDVLSGKVGGPNAADAQRQGDALDRAMGFAPKATDAAAKTAAGFAPKGADAAAKTANAFAQGPKAANDVLGQVNAFAQGPEGPSSASLLQDEASQKAMSDVLSVSRSGRARDAGSQARAANVAQGEIAGMGVDNARNAALLRNKEANDARSQQLSALGLSGDLAQGLDTTKLGALSLAGDMAKSGDQTRLGALDIQGDLAKSRDSTALGALNLGADISGQMRNAGVAERGQSLDFMQGQEQIGAGLTGDVLQTIPALEQVRHDDQFDLTPQQKLVQAKLGGAPDKTTADYVTALLGDVLGAAS